MNYKERRLDYLETVSEEIEIMLSLKSKIDNNIILVDTIVGVINFNPLFGNLMEDVYRFVYIYGGRLQSYGIENRIKESIKNR